MSLFQKAVFHTTVANLRDLPPDSQREVAFAGRSNAGKSSAINTLANHKRLAYVSKTPGRTQLINFFGLGDDRFLVDLPGYGYAKVPPAVKAHWEALLEAYLSTRAALKGLVVIMDARHPMRPLDVALLDWYAPTGKPVHCLLTKSDKLTRSDQAAALRLVKKEIADRHYNATAQLFSSLKKQGLVEAEAAIARMFQPAA